MTTKWGRADWFCHLCAPLHIHCKVAIVSLFHHTPTLSALHSPIFAKIIVFHMLYEFYVIFPKYISNLPQPNNRHFTRSFSKRGFLIFYHYNMCTYVKLGLFNVTGTKVAQWDYIYFSIVLWWGSVSRRTWFRHWHQISRENVFLNLSTFGI